MYSCDLLSDLFFAILGPMHFPRGCLLVSCDLLSDLFFAILGPIKRKEFLEQFTL